MQGKIYVAGHRGLVGSAIVRRLLAEGAGDILMRTHVELDLTNQAQTEAFFQKHKPDYVFLAAARVGGILANNIRRGEFIHDNLAIQLNVMHQAKIHGVKRLVFLGSSCIYPKHAPQPMKEEHLLTGPLEPTNSPYALAKIAGVEMCDAYNKQYGTSFIPVMPTNLYGTGDNFDLLGSHVIPAMMRKFHLAKLAAAGDFEAVAADEKRFGAIPDDLKEALGLPPFPKCDPKVVLWGTGTPRREFLHVDDMADACVYLMFQSESTELTNIGVGEDVTIKELSEMIRKFVGFTGEVVFDADKPDGSPRKLMDVSRLSAQGWQAKVGLEEGLAATYGWYTGQY